MNLFPALKSFTKLLHVQHGREMPPTGDVEPYPFGGLFGWEQTLEQVGIGITVEDDDVEVGFVEVGLMLVTGQVYTEVETDPGGFG